MQQTQQFNRAGRPESARHLFCATLAYSEDEKISAF